MINSKEEKRNFYKTVIALVIPMALQNLINVGVQAADVVMLGRLNETAISAASLAGQIYFIMTLLFFGLTSGAAVLTAQYWGKGDKITIEKVLGLAVRWAVVIAFIFMAAAILFPIQLMHIFSSEQDVIEQGAQYMRIVALAYIPAAITMVYLNVMRSVERVIISTVIYTISLLVNVMLNAVFIFGLLGFPAMGVRGAAIATAAARYCEFFIVLFYAFRMNKVIKIKGKFLLRTEKILISDFVKYALPVAANELLWGTGISLITAIIGHLGKSAVAANSVVQVVPTGDGYSVRSGECDGDNARKGNWRGQKGLCKGICFTIYQDNISAQHSRLGADSLHFADYTRLHDSRCRGERILKPNDVHNVVLRNSIGI